MSSTEYSFAPVGSERLRAAASATSLGIAIANAVSDDVQLLDPANWPIIPPPPTDDEIKQFGDFGRAYEAIRLRDLKELIAQARLDVAARDYIFESPDSYEIERRYHEAIGLRDLLKSLADENEKRQKADYGEIAIQLPSSTDLIRSLTLYVGRSSKQARLDAQGLLKSMIDEGELGRIRRCAYEKCQRFFWAGRVDRPCCQESCRNAYRQQRHRDREKQNRVIKKAMKRSKPK